MSNRVRSSRESRGLELDEFAAQVGVSTRFLFALEEDQCDVKVETALRIARALDSTVEEIFGEEEAPAPRSEIARDVESPQASAETCLFDEASEIAETIEAESAEVEEPDVCDEPVESEEPEVCDEPVASEEPEVCDEPVASDEPEVCDEPVESEESATLEESAPDEPKRKQPKKRTQSRTRAKLAKKSEAAEESPKIAPYETGLSNKSLDELVQSADAEIASRSLLDGAASTEESPRRVYAPRKSQTASSKFSKTATVDGLASQPQGLKDPTSGRAIRCFDLFCGIGGFRYAAKNTFAKMNREEECVLSCDIDEPARQSYAANFGDVPYGDVSRLPSEEIPDFDILFAGFPCQSFSIIGLRQGFADETKGSLFFQVARILKDKRPRAFVLENVRQLTTHDSGRTFEIILRVLQEELGYYVDWRVLNALDCGVPQKRERVVIVGSVDPFEIEWPCPIKGKSLSDILEDDKDVDKRYFASPEIVRKRKEMHTSEFFPSIWHENKSGMISSYPYSCALRAGASYNYLLVNGERRLTPREMLRLQGFPDDFKVVVSDFQIRKQAGNAVPVCLIQRAMERFLPLVFETK